MNYSRFELLPEQEIEKKGARQNQLAEYQMIRDRQIKELQLNKVPKSCYFNATSYWWNPTNRSLYGSRCGKPLERISGKEYKDIVDYNHL